MKKPKAFMVDSCIPLYREKVYSMKQMDAFLEAQAQKLAVLWYFVQGDNRQEELSEVVEALREGNKKVEA